MPAAAAIFDNDGLTLDTEEVWSRAEMALFARYGVTFTIEHKRELLGTAPPISSQRIEQMLDLPGRGDELHEELEVLVMDELERGAPTRPGAVELLDALIDAGVPLGMASNSPRAFADRALAASGLADRFDAVVVGREVPLPKPAPDVYLAVAERLGVAPEDCVALEDSPTGVAAARAAGMLVIGVPSLDGIELEADVVAPSLADRAVWATLGLAVPVP